jgi:RecA-family ATPase
MSTTASSPKKPRMPADTLPNNGSEPQAAPKRRLLPELRDGDYVARDTQPLPDELIHGLLHQGCKMVLGGGSKMRKSWLLADLAISLSAGVPWLGMATSRGVVCYCNFEIGEPFFHYRLREVARAKGVALGPNLRVWNLRGFAEPAAFLLPELGKRLNASLKDGEQLAAIVLDPIYKLALGTEENGTKETGLLLQETENLAEQTGAAV